MKRREVLGLGALAAGAAAGVPGCSVPKIVSEMRGPDGAAQFNAMLDAELAKLEKPGLLQRIAEQQGRGSLRTEANAALAEKDATFRRMLSAILVTQSFRELPDETRNHPDVQARMWQHMDAISSAVYETSDMLAALDANQRAKLRETLRDKPELAMDVGEALDARAGRAGLSAARRRQLRQMMSNASFRLRTTNPSSVIDEYVEKVEKLRETHARDAAALDKAVELGEKEFWRAQRLRLADDPGNPTTNSPLMPPGGPVQQPAPPPAQAPTTAPVDPGTPIPTGPALPDSLTVVRMLTRLARNAAYKGNCKSVDTIGRRIRDIDPAFHARVFATDKLLTDCLPGVATARPGATEPESDELPEPRHPGSKGMRTGGYMLGVGLIISVVSIPLIYVVVGIFTLTAGVVLMALGLVWLYINALVYVAQDP